MTKFNESKAKGGIARAEALSSKRRSEIAKKAAETRWAANISEATHGSPDHPLNIGDLNIPCYVLEGDIRVLTQRGMQTGIGMSTSGGTTGAHRLAQFVESLAGKGIDCSDLAVRIRNPIKFRPKGIGRIAYGYEATILADICDVVLAARKKGKLLSQQKHIAEQCEILVRGFARVGIIALVDEATGFQRDRKRDALSKILEAFIAKELQPYVPTFPADYYNGMFRLRGLKFPADSVKRPQYFGTLTNNIIYKRLAPCVLDELKKITPRTKYGNRKNKFFQRLTLNKGYPKLREHLGSVVTIMKLSTSWQDFMDKLDTIHPKYGETMKLPMGDQLENDSGLGL